MSYTDVETLCVTWLKSTDLAAQLTRPDGGVSIFKAMPLKAPARSIVLSRVGGAPARRSDAPIDVARISFHCWGPSRTEAVDTSLLLVDLLEDLAVQNGFTDGYARLMGAETLSWLWMPDPDSDTPRYVVDALVTAVTG